MKHFFIFTLFFIVVFLGARKTFSFNQATDCNQYCSSGDFNQGEGHLINDNYPYGELYDGCMNGNWNDWCCICEHETHTPYPSICTQYTLSCPIPPITLTPAPVNCIWSDWGYCSVSCGGGTQWRYHLVEAANGGTECTGEYSQSCNTQACPVNCVWSDWSACDKPCGGGTQSHYHLVEAANGGNPCYGSYTQSCNNQACPINCVWSSFGTCLKNGTGCAQKRTHLVEAANGGTACTGSDTQVCYACTDNESTAASPSNQTDTIQITLSTYTGQTNNTVIGPTITQARAQNAGFDLFRQPSPTPTRIPATPTPLPTQPPRQQPDTPHVEPSPTMIPTTTPVPTIPPESIIPESLASQQQNVGGGTSYQVDTSKITNISVAPGIVSKSKPILSQEQRLLANNVTAPVSSGIMVGLQQKTGSQFVTQQDELTVKRGNQFFSISNQTSSAPLAAKTQTNKVASNSTKSVEATPQLEINANNVVAYSSMGLSIDPLSGVLTVETPTGPQKVSIMPDEALGIIIELRALSSGGAEPSILLVSEKGKLIYRITGEKVEKFLGLLPISIQKQVLVSADTGSIITIELSLLSRIMSFFTF